MNKLSLNVFVTILILIMQHIYMAIAIECFECGYVSILQPVNDTMSHQSECSYIYHPEYYPAVDKCSYDTDIEHSRGFLHAAPRLSLNDSLQAVCYSLWGKFRGESIIIRGCDALPLSSPDENGRQCLQDSFKVWLETEIGKEYITDHLLCVCNKEDFCNYDDEWSGGRAVILSTAVVSFMFLLVRNA